MLCSSKYIDFESTSNRTSENIYFPWKPSDNLIIKKYGSGISIINSDDNKIFLTCSHIIHFSDKIEMDSSEIELINDIPELDIALTKIPDTDIDYLSYNINDFQFVFPSSDELCFIDISDPIRKQNSMTVRGKVLSISYEKYYSAVVPELPYINTQFDISDPEGISGKPVYDSHNKILGIVHSCSKSDKTIFSIIPSVVLFRVLDEYFDSGSFNGLCDILVLCEFGVIDNVGHLKIKNNFKIKNLITSDSKISPPYLKTNDIITHINNNRITQNCRIYCSKTESEMPISTYVTLNCISGQSIPITINRLIKKRLREKDCYLYPKNIFSFSQIPFGCMSDAYKFKEIHGMIFMELNEDILKSLYGKGFCFVGSVTEYTDIEPYKHDSDFKHVVLIDIVSNERVYRTLNFPFVPMMDKLYYLPFLSRIGSKRIKSLESISNLNPTTLTLQLDHDKYYHLTFSKKGILYKFKNHI